MDPLTVLIIAITGPAFTESRGFIAFTVKAIRTSFHMFPRILPTLSTSIRVRR
jgi:hypothetical protein